MRPAILLLATGCRGLLGIDEARVADAAPPEDMLPMDAPLDAPACYGAGLVTVCFASPPTGTRELPATLDTSAACDLVQDEMCVIAAGDLGVPLTGTRVTGTRPLVLVAANTLTLDGTLDGASRRTSGRGPGASFASCPSLAVAESDTGGGGGGAGGSFAGRGGNGGEGDVNQNGLPNGSASGGIPAATTTPQALRAGCAGGMGGQGSGPSGAPGAGGGAMYLIAAVSIDIRSGGGINAGGAGGTGGSITSGGGGGGGSGGMIGLDAPQITIGTLAVVAANGGGGGEGGGTTAGNNGADGSASSAAANGGANGVPDAGDGGNGSAGPVLGGTAAGSGDGGGGGGGGGAGVVYVKGTVTLLGAISPPPIP